MRYNAHVYLKAVNSLTAIRYIVAGTLTNNTSRFMGELNSEEFESRVVNTTAALEADLSRNLVSTPLHPCFVFCLEPEG